MDAEAINAAIAAKKGYVESRPTLDGEQADWFVWQGPGGIEDVHDSDCFTEPSAEWCGLLDEVLRGGLEAYFAPFAGEWAVGDDDEDIARSDTLHTAVALAWLEMGGGK